MQAANTDLRRLAADRDDSRRMATTMVAAVVQDSHAYIGNVGDSRAYQWREGQLEQISRDQSLVARLVEEGALTPEEAVHYPYKNVILYSIGSEKRPPIDLYEIVLEPVSYTHLDVYKRQAVNGMFRDLEQPKHLMLQNEEELDRHV